MAIVKKIISRIPQNFGEWYPKEGGWDKKNRLNLFGSEFESLVDGNTAPPATLNEETQEIIVNENWRIISDATEAYLAGDKLSRFSEINNPEYINVELDENVNVLSCTYGDGSHYSHNLHSETIDAKQDKEQGKGLINSKVSDSLSYIEDVENRSEIKTDSAGRIISYRDSNGVIHEEIGIDAKNINSENVEAEKIHAKTVTADNVLSVDLTEETDTLYVERPKFAEVWFEGELPTDTSEERIPTQLSMLFKNSGIPQFKCNCTLAIQGHGSAGYAKKGYTLEPYNKDWEAISIKFGDMIAIDSFHLKAYYTDPLHCRDVGNYRLWMDMMKQLDYPYSKINNIPFAASTTYNKNINNIADAKYAPDGFPVACYLNGEFLGLYTIKLKKSRQNYAMEKSIKSEILMDCTGSGLDWGFMPSGWDIKNPKMKGYEEGGEVPDAEVLATIQRVFNWMGQVDAENPATYADYEDYIVLPNWLNFIIFTELIFSEDTANHNYIFATWDAMHWSLLPWDVDLTVGLHPWEQWPPYESYVILSENVERLALGYGMFQKIMTIFSSELKAYWTKYRKNGFIDPANVVRYYINQCNSIPRDVYAADYKKWGTVWNNDVPSIGQMYEFIKNRIAWLDSQWLNNE